MYILTYGKSNIPFRASTFKNKTNSSDIKALFCIFNDIVSTTINQTCDYFYFTLVNFSFLDGAVPHSKLYFSTHLSFLELLAMLQTSKLAINV